MLPFPINISAALKSPRSLLRHVLSIHSIASGSVTSVKEINQIIVVSSPPCTVKEVELRFRVEPFHKQSSYYFFRICMEFQDDIRGTKVGTRLYSFPCTYHFNYENKISDSTLFCDQVAVVSYLKLTYFSNTNLFSVEVLVLI